MFKKKPIFGVDLDKNDVEKIPKFILSVIEHLKNSKYHDVGIFRRAGSAKEIKNIKQRANKGKKIKLQQTNIHVLVDLLKMYFSEMPESVCSCAYQMMMTTATMTNVPSRQVILLRKCIRENLPQPHQIILERLCSLLYEISQENYEKSKMTDNALALIFAHSLIRPKKKAQSNSQNGVVRDEEDDFDFDPSKAKVVLVELMIRYYKNVFFEIEEEEEEQAEKVDLSCEVVYKPAPEKKPKIPKKKPPKSSTWKKDEKKNLKKKTVKKKKRKGWW